MMLRAASLALLLIATPAAAADWWIVMQQDVQGNSHLAETGQLHRDGDLGLLWIHVFYPKPAVAHQLIMRVRSP